MLKQAFFCILNMFHSFKELAVIDQRSQNYGGLGVSEGWISRYNTSNQPTIAVEDLPKPKKTKQDLTKVEKGFLWRMKRKRKLEKQQKLKEKKIESPVPMDLDSDSD